MACAFLEPSEPGAGKYSGGSRQRSFGFRPTVLLFNLTTDAAAWTLVKPLGFGTVST